MKRIAFAVAMLAASPAFAQQRPDQQQRTQAPDRIAMQIGQLLIRVEQQQDTIATLQEQLMHARARIKELEGATKAAPSQPTP